MHISIPYSEFSVYLSTPIRNLSTMSVELTDREHQIIQQLILGPLCCVITRRKNGPTNFPSLLCPIHGSRGVIGGAVNEAKIRDLLTHADGERKALMWRVLD